MSFDEIQPGEEIAGKYQVDRVIGRGGMATVVAAHHRDLGEIVAIKILLRSLAGNAMAVARFLREGRSAARIRSEHVVRVHDVGKLADERPYLVMEYVRGTNLSQVLGARGALPVDEAVFLFLQACEAVAVAHAVGVVHRDLKPANLMLTTAADGTACVKVLDFGIAKVMQSNVPRGQDFEITTDLDQVGSPMFMAPEQLTSARDVDHRIDIWALGLILFRLLTNRHAIQADSAGELIARIVSGAPTRLRAVRPEAPKELDDAVARCLARDRTDRYRTVMELAAAVAAVDSAKWASRLAQMESVVKHAELTASWAVSADTTSDALIAIDLHPSSHSHAEGAPAAMLSIEPPLPPRSKTATRLLAAGAGAFLLIVAGVGIGYSMRATPASGGAAADPPPIRSSTPANSQPIPEASETATPQPTVSAPVTGSAAASAPRAAPPPSVAPVKKPVQAKPADPWGWER